MPCYVDKKSGRLYIEFQYKRTRYKERLPEGVTREEAERHESSKKRSLWAKNLRTRETAGYVYFIRVVNGDSFKIGFSIHPDKRLKSLESATGQRLELLATRPGTRQLEQDLIFHFRQARKLGEWFWSTQMERDVDRFLGWNDEIKKLDLQLWLDERLDRKRHRLVKRMSDFVESPHAKCSGIGD